MAPRRAAARPIAGRATAIRPWAAIEMPQVPTFTAGELIGSVASVPVPHLDPEQAGRVAETIARGGAAIEGIGRTWAQRYYESRRAVMASDAMVSAQSDLAKAAQQWARKAGTSDANGEI